MAENAVSAKIPTFWPENVDTWFKQVEAQFHLRSITVDETKYSHVVAALTGEAAIEAESLINDPPATDRYVAIKDFLLQAYGLTEAERAEKLLTLEELGTRKPSQLMNKVLHLYGPKPQTYLLKHIFLRALPMDLRKALASCEEQDLRKFAKEADKRAPLVEHPVRATELQDIEAVRREPPRSARLCFFHFKFGAKARNCRPPCAWKAGNFSANSQ